EYLHGLLSSHVVRRIPARAFHREMVRFASTNGYPPSTRPCDIARLTHRLIEYRHVARCEPSYAMADADAAVICWCANVHHLKYRGAVTEMVLPYAPPDSARSILPICRE